MRGTTVVKAGDAIRQRRSTRNADLAAERATKVTDKEREPVSAVGAPAALATWRSWQKENPVLNPWSGEAFLAETWSLASHVEVPLLPGGIPDASDIRRLREACGLSVERVAERAQVTPEMWSAFEHGDDSVLHHINANALLRFCSAMSVCVAAGGPPAPAEPGPAASPPPPLHLIGAELLDQLRDEIGDRCPPSHVLLDHNLSTRIARGELPAPMASRFPTEKEMVDILRAFPGLANRSGRSVPWTNAGALATLMELETNPSDVAEYVPRDDLGVGRSGLLRIIGTALAIIDAEPERVAAIKAERVAAEKRRKDQEAAAVRARAAAAQASLLLAQQEADRAAAALTEGAA
jgi:transcriptional regulator with XRE-family HTH domain